MRPYDLHTHTVLCDGKNTAEEMIIAAIEKGLSAIGLSGHAFTPHDTSYCMTREAEKQYFSDICELKKKYEGKIEVYCGIEKDLFSDGDYSEYDYVIGSVHYVKIGDDYIPVDENPKILKKAAKKYFGGDMLSFAEAYFETAASVYDSTKCDIIGHFDLVKKFNEDGKLFDENSERYKNAAVKALSKLIKTGAVFEINTGAISRGYRTDPYPSDFILREIKSMGGKILLSGDTHAKENLAFKFNESLELSKNCGFDEIVIMTSNGFQSVKI